jgi:DNA topoisomerase I
VNLYVRSMTGGTFTAKDFRTLRGTITAADALARIGPAGKKSDLKKNEVLAVKVTAEALGNTPSVARSSYIDPRVIDLYESGTTIAAAAGKRHRSPESRQADLERAVLEMLAG